MSYLSSFFRPTLLLHDHTASRLVKSEQEENFDKCQRPEDAVTVGFERRVDAYPTVVFALVDPTVGGVVFGNLTLLVVHHDRRVVLCRGLGGVLNVFLPVVNDGRLVERLEVVGQGLVLVDHRSSADSTRVVDPLRHERPELAVGDAGSGQ